MTDNPIVETIGRATVAAIPYVGGSVGEIIFGHRDRTRERRLAAYLDDIACQLKNINESDVDKAYLESEEFIDFLESVLDRASRVRANDKRRRLSRVLCAQVASPIPIDFAELFLDLVIEIKESQILILREHEQGDSSLANQSFRTPRHYSLKQGQYRYLVQVLISRGLMLELHLAKTGDGRKQRPFERLEITELGREFLSFLEH